MKEEEKKVDGQEMTYLLFTTGSRVWIGDYSVRGDRQTSATPVFQRRHCVPACTVEISVIVCLKRLVRVFRVKRDAGSACVGRPGRLGAGRKTEEKKDICMVQPSNPYSSLA